MSELAQTEQNRFEGYWSVQSNRSNSLGENRVGVAVDLLHMVPGETVIDYGCGAGRAAQKLIDQGIDVVGVDVAANCLDVDISIPLVKAPLWELPESLTASDYAFCVNVLDVIPEMKLGSAIAAIEARTKQAAFISVVTPKGKDPEVIVQRWTSLLSAHWFYVDQVRVDATVDLVCRQGVVL